MFLCSPLAGSCTFDEGFSQCDYQQDPYDDFDWTHINTQEVPYVSSDLPQGEVLLPLSCLSFIYHPLHHITEKNIIRFTPLHSFDKYCD